ncbi:unnamed protein product, partial [Protopolystoma xenopodis]
SSLLQEAPSQYSSNPNEPSHSNIGPLLAAAGVASTDQSQQPPGQISAIQALSHFQPHQEHSHYQQQQISLHQIGLAVLSGLINNQSASTAATALATLAGTPHPPPSTAISSAHLRPLSSSPSFPSYAAAAAAAVAAASVANTYAIRPASGR